MDTCDFCAFPFAQWLYLAAERPLVGLVDDEGEGLLLDDDGRWRACAACAAYVDRRDLAALVVHSLGAMRTAGAPVPADPEGLAQLGLFMAARYAALTIPGTRKLPL